MRNRNVSLAERQTQVFDLKSGESPTGEVEEVIVPVVQIRPRRNIIRTVAEAVSTAGTTVFTTPSDKDFFLTNIHLSASWNAANDGTQANLRATVDGLAHIFCTINKQAASIASQGATDEFYGEDGIRIDRGTNITINFSFAAGTGGVSGTIKGYTQETLKG